MNKVTWVWLVIGLIYAAFFSWYTSFGGPLTDEEITHYLGKFEQRSPAPPPEALDMLRQFLEEDTGDDFVMVNVIDMYDTPLQIEGVEIGESSDDVLGKYMAYMYPALFSLPATPSCLARPPTARWT